VPANNVLDYQLSVELCRSVSADHMQKWAACNDSIVGDSRQLMAIEQG